MRKSLLIFAKAPNPGSVKTRLCPPLLPEKAAELYRCMLQDTLTKADRIEDVQQYLFYAGEKNELGYFRMLAPAATVVCQAGDDLGARLTHACQYSFASGHDLVAVIGTDSPDLPPRFIDEAFRILASKEVEAVFGPSEDGGYYLVAMSRFLPQLFRDIPWSSDKVLQTSLERARDLGIGIDLLPSWHDVDTFADLFRPELVDEVNGATLTRAFIAKLQL